MVEVTSGSGVLISTGTTAAGATIGGGVRISVGDSVVEITIGSGLLMPISLVKVFLIVFVGRAISTETEETAFMRNESEDSDCVSRK